MVAYTGSKARLRREIQQSLADLLEWKLPLCDQGFATFNDLADAVADELIRRTSRTGPGEAVGEPTRLNAATRSRCVEAGAALGKVRVDAYGEPVGAVPPPVDSARVQALLAWEEKQASV